MDLNITINKSLDNTINLYPGLTIKTIIQFRANIKQIVQKIDFNLNKYSEEYWRKLFPKSFGETINSIQFPKQK